MKAAWGGWDATSNHCGAATESGGSIFRSITLVDRTGERNAESRNALGVSGRSVRRGEGLSGLVGKVPTPLEEGG